MKKSREKYGEIMKRVRLNSGLTQIELSKTVGVSQSALSKFENGRHLPTIDVFVAIAKATGSGTRIFSAVYGIE